ncbi:hypothetical protein [Singulisphaera sp. PoT]|uniref:hypothetical protein n=1 Tax=Singulisphaera sp. PoT TaxID=3411797 RepID=UPI003BF50F13
MSAGFENERCRFCGKEIQLGDFIGKKGKVEPYGDSGFVHTRCVKVCMRGVSRMFRIFQKLQAKGLTDRQASKLMNHKPERN